MFSVQRLRAAGLTAKAKNCQLGMSQCVYLGHIVGNGQVRPETSKLEAVRSFDTLKTKKQVRVFLGLKRYYQRFIPNYSSIAARLTDLTKNTEPNTVKWTEGCERAFQKLKECLCKAPILYSPKFHKAIHSPN